MTEIIRIGGLSLRFLQDKHSTNGSLDLFEMTVPHEGRMPVAHYHRDWEETAYGLAGTVTFTVAGEQHRIPPRADPVHPPRRGARLFQ